MLMYSFERKDRGAALVLSLAFIASLTFLVTASLSSNLSASRYTRVVEDKQANQHIKDSIVDRALLAVKNYAWTSGNSVGDLLPTTHSNNYSNRFRLYQTSSYDGITYRVYVGDNSDESGNQNFATDTDNKVYVKVAMDFPTGTQASQVLMTPGLPAVPAAEPPAGLAAAIGVCYGGSNAVTLTSLGPNATVSGHDTTPQGLGSCTTSGGCPTGATWYGMSSTAAGGFRFDTGGFHPCIQTWNGTFCWNRWANPHSASVVGQRYAPWHNNPNKSYGRPAKNSCNSFNSITKAVTKMKKKKDPRLSFYKKKWGRKKIWGNRTFGSRSNPKAVLIQTGLWGTVDFQGKVSGYGIMIIDGNATFKKNVKWEGIIINEAKKAWRYGQFFGDVDVNGAMMVNRAFQSSEVGYFSMDLIFSKYNGDHDIQYSSHAIDNVLKGGTTGKKLDPNYTPPASAQPGESLAVFAVQEL